MTEGKRWIIVATFAIAMAWVESAVVFNLRTMIDRIDPYQANPLPEVAGISWIELVREAATLVMLLTVGLLAGRDWRSRFGYGAIAFGVWDVFYYVFLKAMCDWPKTLFDWDILFLLPLPWWGPVIAPMMIAVLMIVWGTLASQWDHSPRKFRSEWKPWTAGFVGIAIALYVFMTGAISVLKQGADAVRNFLPFNFDWGLFVIALMLMSAPILDLSWKVRRRKSFLPAPNLNREAVS